MAKQILGKVKITLKGEYQEGIMYELLDVVTFNGSSYIAKVNTNTIPTSEDWQLLCEKGSTYELKKEDLQNIAQEITNNTKSKFNIYYDEKIESFNTNATKKIEEYNQNADNLFLECERISNKVTQLEDVVDIHTNYTNISKFEIGYFSLADSGTINVNNSNAGFKKCKLENIPKGKYKALNFRGIFCIIEDLKTGEKRKITSTDQIFSGIITLENYSNIYITISSSVTQTYLVSGDDKVPSYVNEVKSYSYKLEDNIKPIIHVEKNGTGDFTTLKEALEYSLMHPYTTIYVGNGTYDLIEEFGADYFSNFNGGSRAGLKLDNYVHIIFASNARVVCHYTGSNDKIKKDFSPFNTIADGAQQKGFTLENLHLECSNVRYAVHDETSGQVNPYRNIYKNCHIVLDNSNNTQGYQQCIGGGLGSSAEIIIENCYFESIHANQTYDIVSYHNGGSGKSNIVITGCYFANKDRCRCSNHGPSTEVSTMMVSNCSLGAEPRIIDEVSGANQNMKLLKWSNEIRN